MKLPSSIRLCDLPQELHLIRHIAQNAQDFPVSVKNGTWPSLMLHIAQSMNVKQPTHPSVKLCSAYSNPCSLQYSFTSLLALRKLCLGILGKR